MYFPKSIFLLSFIPLFWVSCNDSQVKQQSLETTTVFSLLPSHHTNINFNNSIQQDLKFNALQYPYAYNGGGVAIGDINNDGLEDIYLVSNQQSNKLYLNKGHLKFEDITQKAGVDDTGGWSTGVTMVDVNNDGWLDIYVCKSAALDDENLRRNKLFINLKNGKFSEQAQRWGLNNFGFSIQSYFFDFDKDGDLDMYLVNHRHDFASANAFEERAERKMFYETSDHLYRNDGNKFTDVTLQAGIQNKEFGLSASIGDFNNDGWLDIYVANDFITPDLLYINQKNGTFSNEITQRLMHTSYTSMGSDFADINNDLLPDLLVLDMSAEDHRRGKQNMPSMNTKGFWQMVNGGYHYSYMSNMLQLNNGKGQFNEIAQTAGIAKTDWSWAPLIADFDNDGFKDIFITNGIQHELGNQDYRQVMREKQAKLARNLTIDEILSTMPSEKLANYGFKNNGDFTFSKATKDWGLDDKLNSNGVAYGDLDNDGDLDLVLNNLGDKAVVYRNNSTQNFVHIQLIGDGKNVKAVGAKIRVFTERSTQIQELFPSRGYQSSMGYSIVFGLGDTEKVTRIEVIWPDGSVLAKDNVKANQTLVFDKKDFDFDAAEKRVSKNYFQQINPKNVGIDFEHQERNFDDFSKQVLLPQKQSTQGPKIAVADVNSDGLEDFFICGAAAQAGALYIQNNDGTFSNSNQNVWQLDKDYEDQNALFTDIDNDGDQDIYIASGGYEFEENNPLLQDRVYENDGNGNFKKTSVLPKMLTNTKAVQQLDIDNDGDQDLIVGGHVVPSKYPLVSPSYILQNDNGKFTNKTAEIAPEFANIGIVNDLLVTDYDGDSDMDFVVVGEWMPITFFENNGNGFSKKEIPNLDITTGWWQSIKAADLDKDGDTDYLIGNLGTNNKFHPSVSKPLHIYGNHFDMDDAYDMALSKIYKGNIVPVRGRECSSEQNSFVSEKIPTFEAFAGSTMEDIYGKNSIETAYHKEVYLFSSVYLENDGAGNFTVKDLPTTAQFGPTLAFEILDINQDGFEDVIGVGGIHEAEVETVRYDGNTGYVLFGNSNGSFQPFMDNSFYNNQNAKDLAHIQIAGEDHFLVANNGGRITLFKTINEELVVKK